MRDAAGSQVLPGEFCYEPGPVRCAEAGGQVVAVDGREAVHRVRLAVLSESGIRVPVSDVRYSGRTRPEPVEPRIERSKSAAGRLLGDCHDTGEERAGDAGAA